MAATGTYTATCTDLPVVPLWIDGAIYKSASANTFPVHSAARGRDVCMAESADVAAAQLAAESSWTAFQSWKKVGPIQRRDLIMRVASILAGRKEEVKALAIEETSCTEAWAEMNINVAIENLYDVASRITSVSGEIPQMARYDQTALVFKEPIGPILSIAPWNATTLLASRVIAAPIAVGCTVVFKASELCPRTHHFLCQAWTDAGLPKGVLNVLQTRREDAAAVTEALISHKSIRKVEFIGSKAVGNIIGQVAAKYTKPIFLELGGKSAAIVLDDADLDKAADLCLKGSTAHYFLFVLVTLHHGQICFSTERILVQETVAPQFIKMIHEKSDKYSPGYAVNTRMAQNANAMLVDAQQKGAKFLIGGVESDGNAVSLKPTIVTAVTPDMKIFEEETFGPSATLYTFKDDAEALSITNNSIYGLNAAIHTTNMERAIDMAREIEVGQVHINNLTEYDEPTIPVGGIKASGWGRSNGQWCLDEYLTLKTITVNMKKTHTYI